MLDLLADLVEQCNEAFTIRDIVRAISSMKKMSSEAPQIRRILMHLMDKLDSIDTSLYHHISVTYIVDMLEGIRHMNCNHEEVTRVLEWIYSAMCSSDERWDSNAIVQALSHIGSMSSVAMDNVNDAVRAILTLLRQKAQTSSVTLSSSRKTNKFIK
jgi:hypothetical protein